MLLRVRSDKGLSNLLIQSHKRALPTGLRIVEEHLLTTFYRSDPWPQPLHHQHWKLHHVECHTFEGCTQHVL